MRRSGSRRILLSYPSYCGSPSNTGRLMRDQSHWKEIVAPILCTLAAFVIFVLVAQNSQTFRDCIENYQYKAAQSSLPKLSDVVIPFGIRVNCWGRYINEVANGTIAVFTIILAGSTIALWLSTKRLWQVTDDTLRQAPWRFQILNFGKTPGVILRVEWGRCPDGEFPRQIPVSEIIDKNLLPKRMQQKIDMSPRCKATAISAY